MKAISPFDQPHLFSILSVYELPFGRGKKFLNTNELLHQPADR
jgi:hypothetical protein